MKNLENKRVLLFTSQLFDYHNKIRQAIENEGAIVHMYDERNNPSSIDKMILRKAKPILNKKYYKYFSEVVEKESSFNPDYVLFVSPEAIMPNSIKMLKEEFPKAKFILYMWDSIKNKHINNVLPYFDEKFSFDRLDCDTYQMSFRPLFFSEEFNIHHEPKKQYKYDFCFIGTVHSDRAKILANLKEYCDNKGLTYYFYLFVPGELLLKLRRLLNKSFREWDSKYISTKPISKEKVAAIEANSRCIIDINHPGQTGLTMRTIEMIGMGKKIMTTNTNVANYDFYRPENQIIIGRNNINFPVDELKAEYQKIPNNIYQNYSITSWVKDIFSLNEVK